MMATAINQTTVTIRMNTIKVTTIKANMIKDTRINNTTVATAVMAIMMSRKSLAPKYPWTFIDNG